MGKTVQTMCDKWRQAGAKGNSLDIGANLGTYTLPLAKCMKEHALAPATGTRPRIGTLVAIEATPDTAKKLRVSIRKNNLDNIHLYEYAIGLPIEDNYVTMEKPERNMGNAHMSGVTA